MFVGQTSELRSFAKGPDRMGESSSVALWTAVSVREAAVMGRNVVSDVDMCIRLLQAFGSSTDEGCDGMRRVLQLAACRTRRGLAFDSGRADEIPMAWVRIVLCPGCASPLSPKQEGRVCLSPLRALFFFACSGGGFVRRAGVVVNERVTYLIAEFGFGPRDINGRETRGMISKDSGVDVIQTGLLDGWSPSSGTCFAWAARICDHGDYLYISVVVLGLGGEVVERETESGCSTMIAYFDATSALR